MKFARVEPYRIVRQGFPEAIYCPGKTVAQIVSIFQSLSRGPGPVLATRAAPEVAKAIRKRFPKAHYHPDAKMVVLTAGVGSRAHPRADLPAGRQAQGVRPCKDCLVSILTGGTADIPVAEEAAVTAEALGCHVQRIYDVGVAGIHRLSEHRDDLQKARAVIVCAGMEGALPSVVGGLSACPVIAVPTSVGYGAHLGGWAPLLTMLNSCAANVSVVNIDNGFGAGVIAALIAGGPR